MARWIPHRTEVCPFPMDQARAMHRFLRKQANFFIFRDSVIILESTIVPCGMSKRKTPFSSSPVQSEFSQVRKHWFTHPYTDESHCTDNLLAERSGASMKKVCSRLGPGPCNAQVPA